MKRYFLFSLFVFVFASLSSCVSMDEGFADSRLNSEVCEDGSSHRLVGCSAPDSTMLSTKSVMTDAIYKVGDSYPIYSWIIVAYENTSGKKVDKIEGYDLENNYVIYHYPHIHINEVRGYDPVDSNDNPKFLKDLERSFGIDYDFATDSKFEQPLFYGYIYQETGLGRESYTVFQFINLPGNVNSLSTWVDNNFPDDLSEFDSQRFTINYDDFSFYDEEDDVTYSGLQAFTRFGGMPHSDMDITWYAGNALNDTEKFFNKCTVTITNSISSDCCDIDLHNSRIYNAAKQYLPFSSYYSSGVEVYDNLSWQDVLVESYPNDSVYETIDEGMDTSFEFWLPENMAGYGDDITDNHDRNPAHFGDATPTYIEAVLDMFGSLISSGSKVILRGCPLQGSNNSSFDIQRNDVSSLDINLTWTLSDDSSSPWHINNPENWFVEVTGGKQYPFRCYWVDPDGQDIHDIVNLYSNSGDGALVLDNYFCSVGDISITIDRYYEDDWDEWDSFDFSDVYNNTRNNEDYDEEGYFTYTGYRSGSYYGLRLYMEPDEFYSEDDLFRVTFYDPVSEESCVAYFGCGYNNVSVSGWNTDGVFYVGQSITVSSDRNSRWSLELPSNSSNYVSFSASGNSVSQNSVSSSTLYFKGPCSGKLIVTNTLGYKEIPFVVKEPKLMFKESDQGDWYEFNGNNQYDFYLDDSTRYFQYYYADANGNPISFNSTLFNNLLKLGGSSTISGWLISNSYMSCSSTTSSGYNAISVGISRFTYGSGNILNCFNNSNLVRINMTPSYVYSYGNNSSMYSNEGISGRALVIKLVHPFESNRTSGDKLDFSGIGDVINDYYLRSDTSELQVNVGVKVNLRNISNLSVTFSSSVISSYQVAWQAAVNYHGSYGNYVIDSIDADISDGHGDYYLGFKITSGSKNLFLYHHSNGNSNSNMAVPVYLGISTYFKCYLYDTSTISPQLLIFPCYLNARNSYQLRNMFSKEPLKIKDISVGGSTVKFAYESYYDNSSVFNDCAVQSMSNGRAINFTRMKSIEGIFEFGLNSLRYDGVASAFDEGYWAYGFEYSRDDFSSEVGLEELGYIKREENLYSDSFDYTYSSSNPIGGLYSIKHYCWNGLFNRRYLVSLYYLVQAFYYDQSWEATCGEDYVKYVPIPISSSNEIEPWINPFD